MREKKKFFLILAAGLLVCCLSVMTAAYVTRQATADNILTFGNLKMALHQTTMTADGSEVPYLEGEPFSITGQSTVSRILRVENVGEHAMFVRVALQMNGATADGTEFNAESLVSYEINRTDWHYQEGWYYYTKPLNPHETTSELMTQVIFKDISNITQTYPGGRFFLQIDAQAVQSENNADNALNASGWPRS